MLWKTNFSPLWWATNAVQWGPGRWRFDLVTLQGMTLPSPSPQMPHKSDTDPQGWQLYQQVLPPRLGLHASHPTCPVSENKHDYVIAAVINFQLNKSSIFQSGNFLDVSADRNSEYKLASTLYRNNYPLHTAWPGEEERILQAPRPSGEQSSFAHCQLHKSPLHQPAALLLRSI